MTRSDHYISISSKFSSISYSKLFQHARLFAFCFNPVHIIGLFANLPKDETPYRVLEVWTEYKMVQK